MDGRRDYNRGRAPGRSGGYRPPRLSGQNWADPAAGRGGRGGRGGNGLGGEPGRSQRGHNPYAENWTPAMQTAIQGSLVASPGPGQQPHLRPGFGDMGVPPHCGGRSPAPAPENQWSQVVSRGSGQQPHLRPGGGDMGVTYGGGRGSPAPPPQPQYRHRPPPPHPSPYADLAASTDRLRAMAVEPEGKQAEHGELTPMRRPGHGQPPTVAAKKNIPIMVNHFKVEFNPAMVVLHYDVAIQPEPKSKGEATMVKEELFKTHLNGYPLAYDGHKNIFIPGRAVLPKAPFLVQVSREGRAARQFTVTLQLVNEHSLSSVMEYLQGSQTRLPREVLQAMDVIMKENMRKDRLSVGRFFHSKDANDDVDIGGGVVGSWGIQQSLKPTSQGLILCLDYSVIPFFHGVNVMQFLDENLNIHFHPNKSLSHDEKRMIVKALSGLKVTVIHRRINQKFVVRGLSAREAASSTFTMVDATNHGTAGTNVRLVDYFRQKYGQKVKYRLLPCLDLGKGDKAHEVPMEFCKMAIGQRCSKDYLNKYQDIEWKKWALAEPSYRKFVICNMVKAGDGPTGGNTLKNFDMGINVEMTATTARVLSQPVLKIRDHRDRVLNMTPQENGQWNLLRNKVFEGTNVDRWAIVDFLSNRQQPTRLDSFINGLVQRCGRLGITIKGDPLVREVSNMEVLDSPGKLTNLLQRIRDMAQGKLQILICLMTSRCNGYKTLKRISEIQVGIITQCCLSFLAMKPNNDQYLANLALKINAKLGVATVALFNELPCLPLNKGVMFIGADVNHPKSHDATSHSISAVAGTINWPGANKYAARFRIQSHGKEHIVNLGEMCSELIKVYVQTNGFRPEKIFFFRDGVSESEFEMVLNQELVDVKMAICSNGYSPTFTLVVAQKRHQTRLFPTSSDGNVPAGTVVDTVIVDPHDFNFYLCSHNGILGTSKPTHYHVLRDDHGFTCSQLQEILYNLCYTFARCTKPVSLVPPVYYADLVAYRVRFYYESYLERCSTSEPSSSRSHSLPGVVDTEELNNYLKLHPDVENMMFFC